MRTLEARSNPGRSSGLHGEGKVSGSGGFWRRKSQAGHEEATTSKGRKKASSASRIRGKDRERKKRNKIYELVHKGAGTPDGRSDGWGTPLPGVETWKDVPGSDAI